MQITECKGRGAWILGSASQAVLRACRNLVTYWEKSIDIYVIDTLSRHAAKAGIQTKQDKWLQDQVRLECLSKDSRSRLKDYFILCRDDEISGEAIEAMLQKGWICILAFMGRKLVGASWLGFNEFFLGNFGLTLMFRKDQAYGFRAYVSPQVRNKGIGRMMQEEKVNYAYSHGFRYLFSGIYDWNKPSIQMNTRLGYWKVGTLRAWRKYGVKRCELTRMSDIEGTELRYRLGKV